MTGVHLAPLHPAHGLSAYQLAQLYRKLGFHIFQLLPESKKPAVAWGGKQLLPSTEPEFWRRSPDFGIAIACGPASNLFVYDVDTGPGKLGGCSHVRYTDRFGPLPRTPSVLTGSKGLHYYFAWPGFDFLNSASKVGPGLDIKSRGGFVVAPSPSPHPRTGQPYTWIDAPWDVPIAPAPAWLLRALRPPPPRPAPVFDSERIRRARSLSGEDSPLARAMRYVEELAPPSIEGRRGRPTLFGRAAVCVKALCLSDDEALGVLRAYNTRSVPPWTDDELRDFIDQARKSSTIPEGAWL